MPKIIKDWESHGYAEEDWKALSKTKRYQIRYPDKSVESRKKYYSANQEYMIGRQRKYQLAIYGLTEESYKDLFESQSGLCAICSTDRPTGRWKVFAVDHCHITGKVRGLLCNECNRGMGLLRDNAELLRKAAAYLERNINE